ncbi:MAG: prolipoprotein diacylglyceryl transferase [Bryobacteraceae bacterium]|nr:prolipoprotein diacylglyceryl transferase [Bryobacteraceae bacterium]
MAAPLDSGLSPATAWALFMAAGGAMLATWGLRDAPRHGVSREHVLALFLLSWLAGWAGARVWFVIEHRELLREPLWRWILHPSLGGFSSYGGLLSGLAAAGVYARSAKLPLRKLADTAARGLCFFGVAARLGCFFAGCCYGRPTALPWAVSAAPGTLAARRFGDFAALHPVQLYEAAAVVLIGWLAAARPASFAGATFLRVAASYSAVRLFVDALRGDAHLIAGGLPSNQWISLMILALSAGLLWAARRD